MSMRVEAKRLTRPLPGGQEAASVVVEPLKVGEMLCPRSFIEKATPFPLLRMAGPAATGTVTIPVPAFLVRHPKAGPFLVDTGFHPSVGSSPTENLGGLLGRFSHPSLDPSEELAVQLRERDVDLKSIRLVVLTHMHFDHTSGMSELPDATFVVSEAEWEAATQGSRPVLDGYRRAHFNYAFDYRTVSYDSDAVGSYATFGRTFDLFGDGSVRLASTPGHSAGHQSVICRLANSDFVIGGDAVYTIGQLADAPEPPRPQDLHNWRRSQRELARFHAQYPDATITAGHDPEQWPTLAARYE